MFLGYNSLLALKPNLYITDVLDILIVALLIYSIFLFLRRTRSYMVFIGLAMTTGLYIIAKALNLYLTFFALQYFVGISLIIFAIVFQAEIRKYLEILGIVGSRQIKAVRLTPASPSSSEIIHACVQMAQAKIGALIIIQGKDDLEPFLEGGVPLDGVLSEEVLLSIFDPNSLGHDGAVIIKNNRISAFAAHLPLSTNFKEIGKHGTRHSAALGMAEIADSLSIVVSEESGKISICKDGKLKTLAQFDDLEKELNKYIKAKFSTPSQNFWIHLFKHNTYFKLGAFLMAVFLWYFTAYRVGVVQRAYKIPITITEIPENTLIENYSPKEITLTVSGRGDAVFSNITANDFKISVSAREIKEGINKEQIDRRDIVVPNNLALIKYDPENFLLTSRKYFKNKVIILPKVEGNPTQDFVLKSATPTPDAIEVWILNGTNPPTEISTEPISIEGLSESKILPAKLILPENVYKGTEDEDTEVDVAVTIEKNDKPQ